VEKERSVSMNAMSDRCEPVAGAGHASSSAGECGVKDQVMRSGPSSSQEVTRALPWLALIGPTGSGKTTLAARLARECGDVELVSADAMAVYRSFDIGTAKPTKAERKGIAWHLIDVVEPTEEFSVARFQELGAIALQAIAAHKNKAMIVGGTGLYVRAITDGLVIPPRFTDIADELNRRASEPGGLGDLYEELLALDPLGASRTGKTNTRRIVRALEVCLGTKKPFSSFGPGLTQYGSPRTMFVGLEMERAVLDRRIEDRLDAQLKLGFIEEVRGIVEGGEPLSRTARQALGYREIIEYLKGDRSLEETRAAILSRTKRFARRQIAWFRRDPRITWFDASSEGLFEHVFDQIRRSCVGN
jgi:tRNA dimethylallyltransferase